MHQNPSDKKPIEEGEDWEELPPLSKALSSQSHQTQLKALAQFSRHSNRAPDCSLIPTVPSLVNLLSTAPSPSLRSLAPPLPLLPLPPRRLPPHHRRSRRRPRAPAPAPRLDRPAQDLLALMPHPPRRVRPLQPRGPRESRRPPGHPRLAEIVHRRLEEVPVGDAHRLGYAAGV
ncbi:U-box domain-containing protein 2 [Iris pallida]|uniref:U-box domain-containing protein 2 n=1 Tax=Iris pallida TaxID=29817 RepID=A0AAX6FV84_IRIPA|nr:U-box domain-containing protein 2 [Iris pallida]